MSDKFMLIYIPYNYPDNYNTFYIAQKENIKIYGGFPSNGGTWADRDPATYKTTLTGVIPQANGSTVHAFQVVTIFESKEVVLDGFEITEGNANWGALEYILGEEDYGTRTYEMYTLYGGGIYMANSKVELNNLNIHNNSALRWGGGIYATIGRYFITDPDNDYYVISHEYGDTSTVIMNNCIIEENTANRGGGLYSESIYSLVLNNTIVQGNNAIAENSAAIGDGSGGGLYICHYSETIYYNYLNTVLVANNHAAGEGGGIYLAGTTKIDMRTSTIAGNTAITPTGQGIACERYYDGHLIFRGSILAWNGSNNNPTEGLALQSTTQTTYLASLVQGYTTTADNCLPGTTNPLFVNVSGGNYRLQANSSCIDMGCCAVTPTDLDGNPRTYAVLVDMGAYEYSAIPPYHKSTSNENIFPEENIISSNLSLSVYPNPIAVGQQPALFFGEGNLYYENAIDVKVYTLEGKQIHSKTYSTGNTKLDIPQLSSGMYIVNVRTQEGKVYNSKLVITQ
jgi:hypothetical protein